MAAKRIKVGKIESTLWSILLLAPQECTVSEEVGREIEESLRDIFEERICPYPLVVRSKSQTIERCVVHTNRATCSPANQ